MNQRGYTLLEAVITFSFFLLIISIIPLFMTTFPVIKQEKHLHPLELQIFFNQLSMEVREAKSVTVQNNKLFLKKGDHKINTIEQFGNRVRRRVDGTGHEVFLQQIETIRFKRVNHGIEVTVYDRGGKSYNRRLSSAYVRWNDDYAKE